MVRFLHTSDWQIGRQYGVFEPDDALAIAEARIETVNRIALLAHDRSVDAVLVAGDVFDSQTLSDKTLRRLFNALEPFSGPWIMIPGNHDAALPESIWCLARRIGCIPSNVTWFNEPGCQPFPELRLAILAAPLTQRQTHQDVTAFFDAQESDPTFIRVGLAHGSLQGILPDQVDSPNPIASNRQDTARLDYLALGDWHGVLQVGTRTWYSGTPEQDRFKGNVPGYTLEVDIPGPGATPEVIQHKVGRFQWQELAADLRLASDLEGLAERLSAWKESDVIRLRLAGQLDLDAHARLELILGTAHGRTRSLEVDRSGLRITPTAEDLQSLKADGYLGEVVTNLKARQEGSDGEASAIATQALVELASLLRDRTQGVKA